MYLFVWVLLCPSVTSMRGPHHPKDDHVHYQPKRDGTKLTQDSNLLQDKVHLQEDLGSVVSEEQIRKMTPEELEFHYFKLHDFDNNTKLDGLEILQAIRHTLEHEEHKASNDPSTDAGGRERLYQDFHHHIDLIDQVLAEDDTDNDGFLSYIEYVTGRQRDSVQKQKFQGSISNK